ALDVGGELLGRVSLRAPDDASLRVVGVGLAGFVGPRHDRHGGAPTRRAQGGGGASDAGAEDEDVRSVAAHAGARASSSEMSAAMTEWVSAPTDTASTPASAYARTVSRRRSPEPARTGGCSDVFAIADQRATTSGGWLSIRMQSAPAASASRSSS